MNILSLLIKNTSVSVFLSLILIFALDIKTNSQIFINESNGHAYELVQEKLPWLNAKSSAENRTPPQGFQQGHLVTFNDEAEENFTISAFGTSLSGAWIGFTDGQVEGEWKWIDDTPGVWQDPDNFTNPVQTAHTNWREETNEPNNENGIEHYAVYSMFMVSSPEWNDLPNSIGGYSSYLVEYSPIVGNSIECNNYSLLGGEISFYPNPFISNAIIEFPNPENNYFTLNIYNLAGREIFQRSNIFSDKIEFERGNLPSGVYIFELRGEKVFRGKFIIK